MPSRVLKIPIQIPSRRKKSRRRRWEIFLFPVGNNQRQPGKRKEKNWIQFALKIHQGPGKTHTHRGACNKKKRKMDEIGALKVICGVLFSVVLYCLYSMLPSAKSARRNHLGGFQLFSFVLPKGSFPCNSSVNNSIFIHFLLNVQLIQL
jgi:hypothetical protein